MKPDHEECQEIKLSDIWMQSLALIIPQCLQHCFCFYGILHLGRLLRPTWLTGVTSSESFTLKYISMNVHDLLSKRQLLT